MIGTIKGDYWVNLPGDFIDPDETSVVFGYGGPSYIEGKHGTIYFNEYAAIDYEEQYGTNGAVLLVCDRWYRYMGKYFRLHRALRLLPYERNDRGVGLPG